MSETMRTVNRLKAAAILTLLLLAYQQIAQKQNSPAEVIVFYPTPTLTDVRSECDGNSLDRNSTCNAALP